MVKFSSAIQTNKMAFTKNDAVTLATSGDPLVDLFSIAGASRGKNLVPQFEAAHNTDPMLTASLALWMRDVRGGAGERQLFRQYLSWISKNDVVLTEALIHSGKIQEVGRWDDYLEFVGTPFQELAFKQFGKGLADSHSVGLVAKWLPRQGRIATKLGDFFGLTPRNWRKSLVRSTNVVEQLMCAKEWEKIEFSKVPSLASSRYQKAFGRRAPEQYSAYKAALVKKDKSVKVNATGVYPYDVLKAVAFGDPIIAQAQWDALPDYIGNNNGILPILDVSGSMGAPVPGTKITMMDVCVSIGLYIALRQTGDFNKVVMNFSGRSEIVKLKKATLAGMVQEAVGMAWGMNTDLNAAFQNLLSFGRRNHVTDEEMPKTILIISDMEFDRCVTGGHLTNFEAARKEYKNAGYTLPKIVFWCLNGRPGNSPVEHNQLGVALVSGFSPSIMRSVLSAKQFSPRDVMMETINVSRYQITNVG